MISRFITAFKQGNAAALIFALAVTLVVGWTLALVLVPTPMLSPFIKEAFLLFLAGASIVFVVCLALMAWIKYPPPRP